MGHRKKTRLSLYLNRILLKQLNNYCEVNEIDRNTVITNAIENFLATNGGDECEHEITFYLEALKLDLDDMVDILKEKYRDKCIEKGIPVD